MGRRLPDWLKSSIRTDEAFGAVAGSLADHALRTVCRDARCPNRHVCWNGGTATFLIMGNICTRHCTYCAIPGGQPEPIEEDEPERVAAAAAEMGLSHVVVTSVTRDDLPDGGASLYAATTRAVRARLPEASIEVLTPDFNGQKQAIHTVLEAGAEVFNHNLETVRRLQPTVRAGASYQRSLDVLRQAADYGGCVVKSGLMVGLGESDDELEAAWLDLLDAGCDILTMGQYLAPSNKHTPVDRFVTPRDFAALGRRALAAGFKAVASEPLVRSSYRAKELLFEARRATVGNAHAHG